MSKDSSKPLVLLTGANGGIGRCAAREFASRGYDLALWDLKETDVTEREELERLGARVESWAGDLADLGWCEKGVGEVAARFGRIDVLVNNAGWRQIETMNTISPENWNRTLAVCLSAPAFLSRWCAPHMARGGAIINVSSLNARQSTGGAPAYVAAKGGLDSLTHELAALYGPRGIRVVGVAFGGIDTAMSADFETQDGDNITARIRVFAEDMIPLRRIAAPEEAARTLCLLASSDASYITGTTVVADGGWLHHHFPHSIKKQLYVDDFE